MKMDDQIVEEATSSFSSSTTVAERRARPVRELDKYKLDDPVIRKAFAFPAVVLLRFLPSIRLRDLTSQKARDKLDVLFDSQLHDAAKSQLWITLGVLLWLGITIVLPNWGRFSHSPDA